MWISLGVMALVTVTLTFVLPRVPPEPPEVGRVEEV